MSYELINVYSAKKVTGLHSIVLESGIEFKYYNVFGKKCQALPKPQLADLVLFSGPNLEGDIHVLANGNDLNISANGRQPTYFGK